MHQMHRLLHHRQVKAGQAPCETSHDGETVDELRRPACFQRAAMWIAGMRQLLRGSRNEPYNTSSMCITTAMYEIDGGGYQFLGFGIVWNNTSPTNSARCYVCMYVRMHVRTVSLDACRSQSADTIFLYSLACSQFVQVTQQIRRRSSHHNAVCTRGVASAARKLGYQGPRKRYTTRQPRLALVA